MEREESQISLTEGLKQEYQNHVKSSLQPKSYTMHFLSLEEKIHDRKFNIDLEIVSVAQIFF